MDYTVATTHLFTAIRVAIAKCCVDCYWTDDNDSTIDEEKKLVVD